MELESSRRNIGLQGIDGNGVAPRELPFSLSRRSLTGGDAAAFITSTSRTKRYIALRFASIATWPWPDKARHGNIHESDVVDIYSGLFRVTRLIDTVKRIKMEIAFIEFRAADPQLTQTGRGGARFARESERSESKFEMHGNLARFYSARSRPKYVFSCATRRSRRVISEVLDKSNNSVEECHWMLLEFHNYRVLESALSRQLSITLHWTFRSPSEGSISICHQANFVVPVRS